MRVGKIGHEIPLLIVKDKLLIVREDIIGEIREEHKFLDGGEELHDVFLLWEDGLRPKQVDEDLCASDLCSQEHGHEPGLGRELEVGLLHFMLNNAAVDVVD